MKTSERIWERAVNVLETVRGIDRLWREGRGSPALDNKAYRYEQAYKRLRMAHSDWERYELTGEDCPRGRVW